MNNQDYMKCFSCNNRNSYGYCNITYCNYTPIKSQTINEIKQENLIIPCPISNKVEVNKINSLEWVDAEITKWQEILESFKEQLIQVKGTRNEQTTLNHIEFYELRLKYLYKIKSELEAWYVVKNNTMGNNYLYEIVIYKSEKEDYEKFEKALGMNKNE